MALFEEVRRCGLAGERSSLGWALSVHNLPKLPVHSFCFVRAANDVLSQFPDAG